MWCGRKRSKNDCLLCGARRCPCGVCSSISQSAIAQQKVCIRKVILRNWSAFRVLAVDRRRSMANARLKKKVSTRTAQAAEKKTRQKGRRQTRRMAALARTEVRRGIVPGAQDVPRPAIADSQLTGSSGERFRNTSSAQHEQFAGNLGPVLQTGTIFASATRSILQELFNFAQESMHQNFTRLLALAYCRTPPQLIAAQRALIRDNVAGVVRSTGRIADVTIQVAHEGVRRMSAVGWAPR